MYNDNDKLSIQMHNDNDSRVYICTMIMVAEYTDA